MLRDRHDLAFDRGATDVFGWLQRHHTHPRPTPSEGGRWIDYIACEHCSVGLVDSAFDCGIATRQHEVGSLTSGKSRFHKLSQADVTMALFVTRNPVLRYGVEAPDINIYPYASVQCARFA